MQNNHNQLTIGHLLLAQTRARVCNYGNFRFSRSVAIAAIRWNIPAQNTKLSYDITGDIIGIFGKIQYLIRIFIEKNHSFTELNAPSIVLYVDTNVEYWSRNIQMVGLYRV